MFWGVQRATGPLWWDQGKALIGKGGCERLHIDGFLKRFPLIIADIEILSG
jgi:hypothetical protein